MINSAVLRNRALIAFAVAHLAFFQLFLFANTDFAESVSHLCNHAFPQSHTEKPASNHAEKQTMRPTLFALLLAGTLTTSAQQQTIQPVQTGPAQAAPQPTAPSAGADVGHGAGDIGKGAGGAAGNVAKGTGKGAVDLVTLHPVNAAGDVGKGVGVGAKDAGVGAVKGTGKILKGTGKGIKHIF